LGERNIGKARARFWKHMKRDPALSEAMYRAAKSAFQALFRAHPEHFYYCSLVTSGMANVPGLTAWSKEALHAAVSNESDPEGAMRDLKWSYGESPYFCFGEEYFRPVEALLLGRPRLDEGVWEEEFDLRLEAMEAAMRRLDEEGVFGSGTQRERVLINVEVMPPDWTNTERAKRLNPPEALRDWLAENSEEPD
jgi:hypothetical protein